MERNFPFQKTASKGPLALAYTAIFGLCALLGLISGMLFISITPAGELFHSQKNTPAVYAPANGQKNILFIGVDQMDVLQPRLESLWLIAYLPGHPKITFLPLFPVVSTGDSARAVGLEDTFSLGENGAPDPKFFKKLLDHQVWWSGYVLIDEKMMMQSVDDLGGIPVQGGLQDGVQAIQSLAHPWQDPVAALQGQAGLLQSICSTAANSGSLPDLAHSYQLVSSHIRSDLEVLQSLQDWMDAMGSIEKLECEFPLQLENQP